MQTTIPATASLPTLFTARPAKGLAGHLSPTCPLPVGLPHPSSQPLAKHFWRRSSVHDSAPTLTSLLLSLRFPRPWQRSVSSICPWEGQRGREVSISSACSFSPSWLSQITHCPPELDLLLASPRLLWSGAVGQWQIQARGPLGSRMQGGTQVGLPPRAGKSPCLVLCPGYEHNLQSCTHIHTYSYIHTCTHTCDPAY